MSTGNRIKYIDHKYKTNHRITGKAYVSQSTGAKYRIILNLDDMKFYIRNERTKTFIYESKSYGNMNVLKRNARARLEKYGVNLKKESRQRTFGRCEKGLTQEKWEKEQSIYLLTEKDVE